MPAKERKTPLLKEEKKAGNWWKKPGPKDEEEKKIVTYIDEMTEEQREEEERKIAKREAKAKKHARTTQKKAANQKWIDDLLYKPHRFIGRAAKAHNNKSATSSAKKNVWEDEKEEGYFDETGEWENYQKEWDHLLDWSADAQAFSVKKEMGFYIQTCLGKEELKEDKMSLGAAYSTGELSFKCKLCRNAKGKYAMCDEEHTKLKTHLDKLASRERHVQVLRKVLDGSANIHTSQPWADKGYLVLVKKFDEDYLHTNTCWVRCLLCGDQFDNLLTEDTICQRTNTDLADHEGTKRHLKKLWYYTDEAKQKQNIKETEEFLRDVERSRVKVMGEVKDSFYKCVNEFEEVSDSSSDTDALLESESDEE